LTNAIAMHANSMIQKALAWDLSDQSLLPLDHLVSDGVEILCSNAPCYEHSIDVSLNSSRL
jgi:hypothetical protein